MSSGRMGMWQLLISVLLIMSWYFQILYTQDHLKMYSLEDFLNASDIDLQTHKKNLDALIQKKKLNIPQSQAMFFYPDPIKNRRILHKTLHTRVEKKGVVSDLRYQHSRSIMHKIILIPSYKN